MRKPNKAQTAANRKGDRGNRVDFIRWFDVDLLHPYVQYTIWLIVYVLLVYYYCMLQCISMTRRIYCIYIFAGVSLQKTREK